MLINDHPSGCLSAGGRIYSDSVTIHGNAVYMKKIKQNTGKRKKRQEDFFDKVYKVVAKIPYGKVTTYGAIAEVCGIKSSARTVGWALNSAKDSSLPCHRVVNRFGALTGKIHFGSPDLMRELLISEGISFDSDGFVRMDKHFWKPGK